jgi:hypothetical protein
MHDGLGERRGDDAAEQSVVEGEPQPATNFLAAFRKFASLSEVSSLLIIVIEGNSERIWSCGAGAWRVLQTICCAEVFLGCEEFLRAAIEI